MLFQDLRKKDVSSSFHGRDGVRDIQYNPSHYFNFAAALENGSVQVYMSNIVEFLGNCIQNARDIQFQPQNFFHLSYI